MRLRALLIDDESKILHNLRQVLPWDDLGIDVAGLARNGAEALEIAMAERPDIVLCDIRMPVMDGIAFLEAFAGAGLKAEVVMLTGYQDFEYARSVIRYGVRDYMLKPIDYDELTAVIERLAGSVRAERQAKSREARRFGRAVELAYEKMLYDTVMGYAEPDPGALPHALSDDGGYPADNVRYAMLLADLDAESERYGCGDARERRLWHYAARNIVQETLSTAGLRHAVLQTRDGELCVLLEQAQGAAAPRVAAVRDGEISDDVPRGGANRRGAELDEAPRGGMLRDGAGDAASTCGIEENASGSLLRLAYRLQEAVTSHTRIGLSVGVYAKPHLTLRELAAAFRRLQRQMLLTGDRRQSVFVCGEDAVCGGEDEASPALWEPIERLADALRRREREAVERALRALTDHMHAIAGVSLARAVRLGQFAALHLLREMRELGALTAERERDIWRMAERADRAKDVAAVVRRIASDCLEHAAARKSADVLMDGAEAYIRRHLSRDFGIDEAAASLGISASYFSLLFKQRFGCTFVEYVTNERIEMAKSMLLLTDRSVTEIGRAVGYGERRYFTKVFQKMTGEIPSAYRAKRKGAE